MELSKMGMHIKRDINSFFVKLINAVGTSNHSRGAFVEEDSAGNIHLNAQARESMLGIEMLTNQAVDAARRLQNC
jgi:hypothetical protein